MVEDLIFELRVERLKTEKLRKEWQQKKKQYEDQIQSMATQSEGISLMEGEMEKLQQRMGQLIEAYQEREKECDHAKEKIKEINGQKYGVEAELAKNR